MTETPKHSVSVAAAIFDKSGENVLLIKRRDNGHWEPPGGILELGESIEKGLRREIREETGAEIQVGPLTGIYKNMSQGVVALVFQCALRGDFATSTEKAAQVAWHPLASSPDLMQEAYAVRLADSKRSPGCPAVRAHSGF